MLCSSLNVVFVGRYLGRSIVEIDVHIDKAIDAEIRFAKTLLHSRESLDTSDRPGDQPERSGVLDDLRL
jgi:hypothetical protein